MTYTPTSILPSILFLCLVGAIYFVASWNERKTASKKRGGEKTSNAIRCSSCGEANNPSFCRCWRCGHDFETWQVEPPASENKNVNKNHLKKMDSLIDSDHERLKAVRDQAFKDLEGTKSATSMTFSEAEKIFKSWQDFMEIADKLTKLMIGIPESFLPYPKDVMEEGLNIMAEFYFNSGDKETSKVIQTTMLGYLMNCKKDVESLESMKKMLNLISENPELKKTVIDGLHESRDRWLKTRRTK